MCGAAACSRFPGPGTYASRCFLPSPPPQGGRPGLFRSEKGDVNGVARHPLAPRRGGQPLSCRKRDGDGGVRHPLAPRRGASLFPFRKGTSRGLPAIRWPPGGGPASFLPEKGRRWGCRGCSGRGPSTPQQASPSFRRRWRSSRAPAPKVNRVPRVRIFATPGPPVLGSTAPVVLVQVTAFPSLRVKRTEFSLS